MAHHAGNLLHYHGFGEARYGHRHWYLSIMHDHEADDLALDDGTRCPNCDGTHWSGHDC